MIARREFITLLGGAAAWPVVARGQAIPKIGYLHVLSEQAGASTTTAFRKGLSEAGFIEGHNVVIEYRFAAGQLSTLPQLANDLVRAGVNVIAAMGGSRSALEHIPSCLNRGFPRTS